MDQAHTKALAALHPFIYEVTSAKSPSPRFLKELIVRATSAPGTYVFTELLQTPAIQTLRTADPQDQAYLTVLELFSWGTYEEYQSTPGLPQLSESQTEKLRQLSLLTIASPFAPTESPSSHQLAYSSLLTALSLPNAHALESLVTSAIYAGLLTARLSPTSSSPTVHITSVAPLRDLRPQSLPALLQILQTWESRCSSVAAELQARIDTIKVDAVRRDTLQRKRQEMVDTAVVTGENADSKVVRSRNRQGNKRDLDDTMEGDFDEDASSDDVVKMEVEENLDTPGPARGVGSSRGAKRNRGRGSA